MRNVWFVWINFVCMLFVIYEHMYATRHTYVVDKIGLLAVPLFAMTAGYAWGGFLKRTRGAGGVYAMKMFFLPYLFWTIAYYVLNEIVLDVVIRGQSWTAPSIGRILGIIFLAGSSAHLYFMSTLVELFLLTIVLRKSFKRDMVFYGGIVLIGTGIALFSVLDLSGGEGLRIFQMYPCWVVPNLCLGMLLAVPRADFYKQKLHQLVALFFLLVGAGVHFLTDGHLSSILLAGSIVVLAMAHPKIYAPQWVLNTAPYIMGIYLVHALFDAAASEAWKQMFPGLMPISVGWALSVLIFFASMMAVYVQRKIPIVRELV